MKLLDDSHLQITNTNHQRLLLFDFDYSRLGKPVLEIKAPGKINPLPISATRLQDGRWAILFSTVMLADAKLMLFNEQGAYEKTIAISGAVDLRTLIAFNGELLVGDVENLRLFRLDPDSETVGEFADTSLQERLAELRKKKHSFSRLADLMLGVLILIVILAFMLAFAVSGNQRRSQRQQQNRPLRIIWQPAHHFTTVVWVCTDKTAFAGMKRMLMVAAGLIVFLDVMLLVLLYQSGTKPESQLLLWQGVGLSGLFLLISLLTYLYFQHLRKYQIGSDGRYLYFKNPRNQVLQIQPEQVVYNPHQLSYGPYTLLLYNPQNNIWFYPQQRFEDFILPLLEQGRRLSLNKMMIYLLYHRNQVQLFSLLLLAPACCDARRHHPCHIAASCLLCVTCHYSTSRPEGRVINLPVRASSLTSLNYSSASYCHDEIDRLSRICNTRYPSISSSISALLFSLIHFTTAWISSRLANYSGRPRFSFRPCSSHSSKVRMVLSLSSTKTCLNELFNDTTKELRQHILR